MKNFRLRLLILTLLLSGLLISNSVSAKELTLNDCIELALKNRASIIVVRGNESRAKSNKLAALGAFLPNVSASYSNSESKRTDIETKFTVGNTEFTIQQDDQDRSNTNSSIRGNMWLFNPSVWFNYFGASAARSSAHLDVLNSEQQMIYSVKVSYYAYLATKENVIVQQEAVKRSQEQLKLIQSKFDLGSAAKSDVLKQKVRFGNDRLALLSAENGVVETHARLAYTIGIDPNSDISFSGDYNVREYSGSLNDAVSFALEHEPGLLSAKKSVDAQKHAVRSRKADYLPKLSLFGSYSTSSGTQGDTLIFDFSSKSQSIGINVSWNIFDGFSRERNLSNAKVNRNNARAAFSDTRNAVTRDVKIAFLEIERLKETKLVSAENVEAATEDLRITQEKYNLGSATILDLLNVQVSLKEAQQSLIKSDFDYNLAIAQLENSMGKM